MGGSWKGSSAEGCLAVNLTSATRRPKRNSNIPGDIYRYPLSSSGNTVYLPGQSSSNRYFQPHPFAHEGEPNERHTQRPRLDIYSLHWLAPIVRDNALNDSCASRSLTDCCAIVLIGAKRRARNRNLAP